MNFRFLMNFRYRLRNFLCLRVLFAFSLPLKKFYSCFMLLHATSVAVDGKAVLLVGPPGSGKSDLALRLIDQGARLVSDDQTILTLDNGVLIASPPETIRGLMEIRHIGLIEMPYVPSAAVALYVELTPLDVSIDRLPEPAEVFLLDRAVKRIRLPSFAASTCAKIRAALTRSFKSA